MSRLILPLLLYFLYSVSALAAGGGEQHGVPSVVIYQTINVLILVGLLTFLLKDKVKQVFKSRGEEHQEAVLSAKRAMEEAEARLNEVQEKIKNLTTSETETLEKAKTESVKLKEKLIAEAKQQAEHILQEAERTKKFETEKAVRMLKVEALEQAMNQAETEINNKIKDSDLHSLNKEFVENVGVVQ